MQEILIVGAGAIGGVTAAFLKEAGVSVTLIVKYSDLANHIRTQGLHVLGFRGEQRSVIPSYANIDSLLQSEKKRYDFIILATKVTDIKAACRDLKPLLNADTPLVSFQNGISEVELDSLSGPSPVVGCVVGWGASLLSAGKLEMTSTGEFVLGNIYRSNFVHRNFSSDELEDLDEKITKLGNVLNNVVPTRISFNIFGELYSKLIVNACITSLGAVSGLRLGAMLKEKKFRKIFLEIMKESMAVANAMKLQVEPYSGKLDYYQIVNRTGFIGNLLNHLLIRIIGFKYRRLRSSMLQSLDRNKPTEIDALNGFLVQQAIKYGVDVPVNSKIVSLVKEIECGNRKSQYNNFDDPAFS